MLKLSQQDYITTLEQLPKPKLTDLFQRMYLRSVIVSLSELMLDLDLHAHSESKKEPFAYGLKFVDTHCHCNCNS